MSTREQSAPSAIIFDVDGTLYDAKPVRQGMARRLVLGHLAIPWKAPRVLKGLSAFRKAQEALRDTEPSEDLHRAQLAEAEERSGVSAAEIDGWVHRWMEERPLDLVAAARRPGLVEFLERARERGLALGAFSDYPPLRKLEALGIAHSFDAVRWAQEPGIGVFKPNPAGILRTLADLACEPAEALYVGDRPEVDGAAAESAGMRFALVGDGPGALRFHELGAVLDG